MGIFGSCSLSGIKDHGGNLIDVKDLGLTTVDRIPASHEKREILLRENPAGIFDERGM